MNPEQAERMLDVVLEAEQLTAQRDEARAQRDVLLAACEAADNAFVSWQLGQIPGRPEDILALIAKVRAAIANVRGGG